MCGEIEVRKGGAVVPHMSITKRFEDGLSMVSVVIAFSIYYPNWMLNSKGTKTASYEDVTSYTKNFA
jgi:hypothetical protein